MSDLPDRELVPDIDDDSEKWLLAVTWFALVTIAALTLVAAVVFTLVAVT